MSDLVTALDLSRFSVTDKFFIVTKDAMSDLNFIFSELLTFYIKKNYSVILVNFGQSSSHYNHLLVKSGIRHLRDQHNLIIVDGLSAIEKLTDSLCETTENLIFSAFLSNSSDANCLKELYNSILKAVELLKQTDKERKFILFIDEISILLNMGLSMNAIEPFVQYCRTLCISNTPAPNILLFGSAYDENDPGNIKLVKFLFNVANTRIQIEGLKTGYSKDAHGKVSYSFYI